MATKRWTGKALDVRQVDTIAIGGTWASSDTVTLTIGSLAVVITVGTLTSTAQVATTVYEALAGSSFTDSSASANVIDTSGVSDVDSIPEFSELSSSVNSSTVTIRGKTAGKPFELSASKVSTSGTLTHTADGTGSSVVATGKNWFDNDDNWDTGTAPTTGDAVVFDGSNIACLYGLDQSGLTILDLVVTASYTATIGLAEINTDDSAKPYVEYRDKYLTFGGITSTIEIGRGTGNGSGRIRVDASAQSAAWKVYGSGTRLNSDIPAVLLKSTGTDSSIYAEGTADVGFSYFADESGHLGTVRTKDSAQVYCGSGCDVQNAAITALGGSVELNSDLASATINAIGGVVTVGDVSSGSVGTVNARSGSYIHKSDMTVTTLVVASATADFDGNSGSIGVTNCTCKKGATVKDNFQRVSFTNDIILDDCGREDVTLELGKEITVRRV